LDNQKSSITFKSRSTQVHIHDTKKLLLSDRSNDQSPEIAGFAELLGNKRISLSLPSRLGSSGSNCQQFMAKRRAGFEMAQR